MQISVIIPVYEDREELVRNVDSWSSADELVVVDSSESDPVLESDLPGEAHLIGTKTRGRAEQMNLGAERARGEAVLFLHADTRLTEGAFEALEAALEDPKVVGGGFERRFDVDSWFLRWTCRGAAWRGRRLGWFLGDQAIFVRKDCFEEVGGFRPLKAFEDLDLCRRLKKKGELRCLEPAVVSSGRRFERDGDVGRTLKDLALTVVYFTLGTRPFRSIQSVK